MYVPGYSGLRVVYGHPFETINAAEQEMNVNLFFEKSMTFEQENSFIAKNKVSYVILEPGSLIDQTELLGLEFDLVYRSGEVRVFAKQMKNRRQNLLHFWFS